MAWQLHVPAQVPTMSLIRHQGNSFLKHPPRLTLSPEGTLVAGGWVERRDQLCSHSDPILQISTFSWGVSVTSLDSHFPQSDLEPLLPF